MHIGLIQQEEEYDRCRESELKTLRHSFETKMADTAHGAALRSLRQIMKRRMMSELKMRMDNWRGRFLVERAKDQDPLFGQVVYHNEIFDSSLVWESFVNDSLEVWHPILEQAKELLDRRRGATIPVELSSALGQAVGEVAAALDLADCHLLLVDVVRDEKPAAVRTRRAHTHTTRLVVCCYSVDIMHV